MIQWMTLIGVTFKDVPVRLGVSLLHSPEKWASGAGLMAGISPFRIEDVKGPFILGKECMVELTTQGLIHQRLRLIARQPDAVTVTLSNPWEDKSHTTVYARVTPLSTTECGFVLVLDIHGNWDVNTTLLKQSLQTGLWGCVNNTVSPLPPLLRYREHLGYTHDELGLIG